MNDTTRYRLVSIADALAFHAAAIRDALDAARLDYEVEASHFQSMPEDSPTITAILVLHPMALHLDHIERELRTLCLQEVDS